MTSNIPSAWNDAEEIEGLDLVDKRALVGIPFRVFRTYFETNKDGINFVYLHCEATDGSLFAFNDSSTGVRKDMVDYLTKMGREAAIDSGEHVSLNLLARHGLRVSDYEVQVENKTTRRMETRKAATYYITKKSVLTDDAAPAATATKGRRTAVKSA
jgi:hypothetical protein